MAISLTTGCELNLKIKYVNDLDLADAMAQFTESFTDALANGTLIDQADLIFWDQRSVTSGTPDDLDLAGSLTDAFGQTLTFVKIKMIYIRNKSTTAAEILSVGGDANGLVNWVGTATDVVKVGPGGCLFLWNPSLAGYGVTAATGDILQIATASGTVTYDVMIIGTSA